MNKSIFATIVLACFLTTSQAALSIVQEDYLKMYDSMAINEIWRVMTYITFYKYIANSICSSTYANYLADTAGLFSSDDVDGAYDVPTLCM